MSVSGGRILASSEVGPSGPIGRCLEISGSTPHIMEMLQTHGRNGPGPARHVSLAVQQTLVSDLRQFAKPRLVVARQRQAVVVDDELVQAGCQSA